MRGDKIVALQLGRKQRDRLKSRISSTTHQHTKNSMFAGEMADELIKADDEMTQAKLVDLVFRCINWYSGLEADSPSRVPTAIGVFKVVATDDLRELTQLAQEYVLAD